MSVQSETFRFVYEGDEADLLDATALGDALLALPVLVSAANRQANNDGARIDVKIRAFNAGSFEISVQLIRSIPAALVDALTNQHTTALLAVMSILGLNGLPGVLAAFRELGPTIRKHSVRQLSAQEEELTVQMQSGDTRTLVVARGSTAVVCAPQALDALKKVVAPMQDGSATGIRLEGANGRLTRVTASEFDAIDMAEATGDELVDTVRTHLQLRKIQFPPAGVASTSPLKWQVTERGNKITVVIADPDFIESLKLGRRVGSLDLLEVDMQTVQRANPQTGIFKAVSHTVLRVVSVIAAPVQQRMF